LSNGQDDSSISLRFRLDELEQQKFDLLEEIERTKQKAREMLAVKDIEEKRLKASLQKF
jgi:hypothetical protein